MKRPVNSLLLHVHVNRERADALFAAATAGMDDEIAHKLRYSSESYRKIVRAEVERRLNSAEGTQA